MTSIQSLNDMELDVLIVQNDIKLAVSKVHSIINPVHWSTKKSLSYTNMATRTSVN